MSPVSTSFGPNDGFAAELLGYADAGVTGAPAMAKLNAASPRNSLLGFCVNMLLLVFVVSITELELTVAVNAKLNGGACPGCVIAVSEGMAVNETEAVLLPAVALIVGTPATNGPIVLQVTTVPVGLTVHPLGEETNVKPTGRLAVKLAFVASEGPLF